MIMTPRLLVIAAAVVCVAGHGRMTTPAARNAYWAHGPTDFRDQMPKDWNLDGLAAGGPGVVPLKGYGVCGDEVGKAQTHVKGGYFGKDKNGNPPLVSMSVKPGEVFTAQVVLTAHHDGFFEWRICNPGNDPWADATQECLDQHVLELADPSSGLKKSDWIYFGSNYPAGAFPRLWGNDGEQSRTKWPVPKASAAATYLYSVDLRMPDDIACERCVMQWYYQTGNSPAPSFPEEFFNCADVEVLPVPVQNVKPDLLDGNTLWGVQEIPDLGPCGKSGTASKQKCFSQSTQATDSWCDNIQCFPSFLKICAWLDVDENCAAINPPGKAPRSALVTQPPTPAPTPRPTPATWSSSWSASVTTQTQTQQSSFQNMNSNTNFVSPSTPNTFNNRNTFGLYQSSWFNYESFSDYGNYYGGDGSYSGGSSGSGGGCCPAQPKTVTTTASTTTSKYGLCKNKAKAAAGH